MAYCLDKGTGAFLAGDRQKAHALLNKALEIRPDLAYTYYTLGYFYYAENNYKEAQARLNKAIEIDSNYWPAYKLLGDISVATGNYEEAINQYRMAADSNNSDASIYNDLALALMKMERYQEAVGYLKEAVRLAPENLDIRFSLANVCKDAKMFNEAIAGYKEVILRQPDYPNVHNDLADVYKEQGNKEETQAEYQKEIDYSLKRLLSNPNNAVTLNSLAYAYNGMGKYKEAQEAINKALAIQPNYREAYLTLAKIQEKSGDNTEALAALTKAKSLSQETNFIDRDIARIKKESLELFKNKTPFLPSDIVYLKNGRKLAGVIKSESKEKIILETYVGTSTVTITLSRDAIERIFRSSNAGN
jgi:tetratricopeptide (TPR) repeat protein